MALFEIHYPTRLPVTNSTNTSWQTTLQAVGDYVGIVRQAEESATITSVGLYVDYYTVGASDVIRVGLQSVNSNGEPSGTWLGYVDKTATTGNFPYFGYSNHVLSTSVSLVRGQLYAIVAQALSGTWSGAQYFRTNDNYYVDPEGKQAFPYMAQKVAGSVTKANAAGCYTHFCSSSTRAYGQPHQPGVVTSISNASSPNEIGNYFRIPTGTCTSYSVLGVRLYIGMVSGAGTFNINLYDSSTNLLQQNSFTCSQVAGGINPGTSRYQYDLLFDEATLTSLSPGSYYRAAIAATNATAIGDMGKINFPVSLGMTAYTGASGTYIYTSRSGTGAWTDVSGQVFAMKLIISDVTGSAGASGGGPLVGGRLVN